MYLSNTELCDFSFMMLPVLVVSFLYIALKKKYNVKLKDACSLEEKL